MSEIIKDVSNWISNPPVLFTLVLAGFFFVFPPSDRLLKINRRLRIDRIWTNAGGGALLLVMTLFLLFGMTDPDFRLIVLKPDNVPIVAMLYLIPFFVWLSMKQAMLNDRLIEDGEKVAEHDDPNHQVLVWPDLVYIELIALILVSALLIVWSIGLDAPLEEPANPTVSPNPAKAPWYFLGLQEMLVYFDPWIAGVVLPTLMVGGLMVIPYIDDNPRGQGYYSFEQRKMAVSLFCACFLVLWVFLIIVGTFLRGPNWNFFGPFEYWDVHKVVALSNVNLSEYIYLVWLKTGLPNNIFLREVWGILLVGSYLFALPPLLARTFLRTPFQRLGALRYSVFVMLSLVMFSIPIKMYLRWTFNLKYLVAIPEYFFNI